MNDDSKFVGYSRFCNANSSESISVVWEDVEFGYIVFALFVAVIGILGNTSILLTFFKKRHHANFYHLMIVLSIYDNLSIVMNLILFIVPNLIKSEKNFYQIIETENSLIPLGYPILETTLMTKSDEGQKS